MAWSRKTAGGWVALQMQRVVASGPWSHLKIGGGGLVTNLSQATVGGVTTLVAGSDGRTYHSDGEWVMDQTEGTLGGYVPTSVEETATPGRAVAPSQPATQWALFLNDVWKTVNGGTTWTSMETGVLVRGNDVWRSYGPRIAIDPRSPSHVLVGTQYDGLLRTTTGAKPTAVAMPAGVDVLAGRRAWLKTKAYGLINRAHKSGATEDEVSPGVTAIMFDPTSPATAGGLTSRAFAVVADGDVIKTEDGAATWARTNAPYPFIGAQLSLSPHNGDLLAITPTLAYSITRAAATTGGTFTISITDAAGTATTAALAHNATSATILTAVNGLGKGTWNINRYVNESTWVTNNTIDFLLYLRSENPLPAAGYTMTLASSVTGGALTMKRDVPALGDTQNKVFRLRAGAWADKTPPSPARTWGGVRHNPHVAGHVVVGAIQGNDLPNRVRVSLNDGDAWGNVASITPDTATSDVPWLAEVVKVGGGAVQGFGEIAWHPTDPKKFLNVEGTGVWEYELANTTANNPPIVVRARTAGIEHLVANDLLPLPKKTGDVDTRLLQASWDRPIFKLTDRSKYPSTYGPTTAFGSCWALGSIPDDPDFIVATVMNHQNGLGTERTCFSTDRADAWTAVAARPDATTYSWGQGYICPSTRLNWLWTAPGSKVPYVTFDGGATWTPITLPGGALATATDTTGSFNWARRKAVVALGPLWFVLMVKGQGVFETKDGGATWTRRAEWSAVTAAMGTSNDAFGARLISVDPATGKPGWGATAELWWITGTVTGTTDYVKLEAVAKSVNGGVTWTKVPGLGTTAALAFGPRPDGTPGYLAMATGWDTTGKPATQVSTDGTTWTRVGGSPGEAFKPATCAAGDPLVPGRFYVGTASGTETLTV